MKHIFYIFTALFIIFSSCAQQNRSHTIDAHEGGSESRPITAFTKIESQNMAKVKVEKGANYSLSIEVSPSKYLKNFKTTVKNGTLKIYTSGTINNLDYCKVYVTTPTLEGVKVDGMSEMDLKDTFEAENFNIEVNSMGKFKGDIVAQNEVTINMNSQAKADVDVSSKHLIVNANSMGIVNISGKAKTVNFVANSMAKIKAPSLKYESGEAEANSMGKIEINTDNLSKVIENSQGRIANR